MNKNLLAILLVTLVLLITALLLFPKKDKEPVPTHELQSFVDTL